MSKCERCEELTEALQRIVQWADAYPTSVFREPTEDQCRHAHELLTANGMTLDTFSASMGRHCLKGVGDIARNALSTNAAQPVLDEAAAAIERLERRR